MSKCIYHKAGKCTCEAKCKSKLLTKHGEVLCQCAGDLGTLKITSEGYRPIES